MNGNKADGTLKLKKIKTNPALDIYKKVIILLIFCSNLHWLKSSLSSLVACGFLIHLAYYDLQEVVVVLAAIKTHWPHDVTNLHDLQTLIKRQIIG